MNRLRFHCKTNNISITTAITVVVMLLLFNTSCGKEKKEVVDVTFDKETSYTIKTTDVTSLISDSGITRYRMNAKEHLIYGKAIEPYWYFPEGIYIEQFDTLFNTIASVKADTGYYWDKKGLAKLINNVKIKNQEGQNFETSLLYLDEKADRAWSDQYIRIQQGDKIITGIGFESNLNMTNYRIFHGGAEIPVKDTTPADSTQVQTDSARIITAAPTPTLD